MRIVTFNINGVRAREEVLRRWLSEGERADVILLQELKSASPEEILCPLFEPFGYEVCAKGEKGFNGVAVLSRIPMKRRCDELGEDEDKSARYLEVELEGGVVVSSVYVPNGNPVEEKLGRKLSFLSRLYDRMKLLRDEERLWLMGGDYNVCPSPALDTHDERAYEGDALCHEESLRAYRKLLYLGVVDAWRSCHGDERGYTFWDYQGGSWQKDEGVRIDHFFLSPWLADKLESCEVDTTLRSWSRPSDHTPLVCSLSLSGRASAMTMA
jgi:exodeoxyribonuclease-3